ncbi:MULTISPECIES: sugar ABC transporter substrate-binding protein [unclassified Crossiella]|uniref:ABC transporter substrate-binding protein n=1 Tax=unclassified Crossiella TaxID=2620835 RepID=UPI001FFF03B4|nr:MULTISPECIES: sugar ABC transporter substrate-binding protein [unclassified Crossiella]MCK2241935.1 sugar ABC transporter substrate-binding protein [Crossiella sp. S99.2]MCK2255838.1 sugar ABC transporter substrate-binding protein [Crossiella sp. S99.1]
MGLSRRTLLTAAAALPVLAACGRSGQRTGAVWFEGWDYEATLVQQNLDSFGQANPDLRIEYTPITSAQYVRKVVAEFTGDNGPDALYCYDDSLASWAQAGYLQPIDDLPGVDEVYKGLYESNAKAMTYQGKRYGLPYYTDCHGLLYNAELLGKAGISTPPASLDELEAQALRIKEAGILRYPIGFPAQLSDTWSGWIWTVLYGSGGALFTDDLRPNAGNDPAVRDVLAWVRRAATVTKVIDPASLQQTPVPLDNAFMAGQYAFTIGARYAARAFNDPARSKVAGRVKLGYVPSLDGRRLGTAGNTRMYCLAAHTQVKDQAFRLLRYLGGYDERGSPLTARFWFLKRGLGFAFPALERDPEITSALAKFTDPAVYSELAGMAKARNVLAVPWYAEYEHGLQKTVQRLLTDQTDAAGAAAALDRSAELLARRYS